MPSAPTPPDEAARVAALQACRILDTPDEESFDDLAIIASQLCATPVALVSLVDSDRQWFKARVNFELTETPRSISFCAHALACSDPLVVGDTHEDKRFVDNPLVVGEPGFRFYAGVPLHVSDGSAVGTLCVLDYEPRTLSTAQLAGLQTLARHIERELGLRRALGRARSSAPPAFLPLATGDVVGKHWTLVRQLGEGGAGVVFEARGLANERAAIKFLRPEWLANEQVVQRFAREARVLARLRSPHVARLLDVGNLGEDQAKRPFIVLEYLEGTDLEQLVERSGKIAWRQAVSWMHDACRGVAAAHELGIIHRDLKPSNVFLARMAQRENGPQEEEVIKVLDFGIAKLSDEGRSGATGITRGDEVIGTTLYMSPEQMLSPREVDAATDVWALGAVLYHLIVGSPPFGGRTDMEICAAILARPPLPTRAAVPDAPAELDAIVRRCLEKPPARRFGSVGELADALRGCLSKVPVTS